MNKNILNRILALLAVLAMALPVVLAEELDEMALYDASIYDGDASADGEAFPSEHEIAWTDEDLEVELPESEISDFSGDTAAISEGNVSGASEAATPDAGAMTEQAPPAENAAANGAESESLDAAASAPAVDSEAFSNGESVQPGGEAPAAEGETLEEDPEERPEAAVETLTDGILQADGEDAAVEAAVSQPGLRLGVGEVYALDGKALLGKPAVGYLTDSSDILTVNPVSGEMTARALGTAVVTVTGEGGSMASCRVEVLKAPDRLILPETLILGHGEQGMLTVQLPEGTGAAGIAWSSSKSSVVAVDTEGKLTAKKKGTAVITALAYNGATASCRVTVLKAPSKVRLSSKKLVLCIDETQTLTAKLPNKSASGLIWESDNAGVVQVDAQGKLRGVSAGTATVTVHTFNNRRAACKVVVLSGKAPTSLSLGAASLTLGKKEKLKLNPVLGEGEAALFAYKSSKKRVASVSSEGVVTAKRAGTAVIAVATHNGLTATVTITVGKAPGSIKLSKTSLSLETGESFQLKAQLPSGCASTIAWSSSDAAVADVDADGNVLALNPGSAIIHAVTYNGKTADCSVTVTESVVVVDDGHGGKVSSAQMAARLRECSSLGSKRGAMAGVVELLVNAGFEPAFAAGVAANIYGEGTYGKFESSKYISNYLKRPRYFCYLDGGDYYTLQDGEYVLTAVYLSQEEMDAYDGPAEKRLRFREANFYWDNYSGKHATEIDLCQLESLLETLAEGKWQGKFGLGIVQWTGGRTKTLVSLYRKHAGSGSSITQEQVIAAENEMILYELNGKYKGVYNGWKNANSILTGAEAARSAGSIVCLKYEVPTDKETKSVKRGEKAAEIYKVMMGE